MKNVYNLNAFYITQLEKNRLDLHLPFCAMALGGSCLFLFLILPSSCSSPNSCAQRPWNPHRSRSHCKDGTMVSLREEAKWMKYQAGPHVFVFYVFEIKSFFVFFKRITFTKQALTGPKNDTCVTYRVADLALQLSSEFAALQNSPGSFNRGSSFRDGVVPWPEHQNEGRPL